MAYFPAHCPGGATPRPLTGSRARAKASSQARALVALLPDPSRVLGAGNCLFPGTLPFTPLKAGLEVFILRQRRAFKSQQENHVDRNTVVVY